MKRKSSERFHLIVPMERSPICEAVRVCLPLAPVHLEIGRQPSKDLRCESGASRLVMMFSDGSGSGTIKPLE